MDKHRCFTPLIGPFGAFSLHPLSGATPIKVKFGVVDSSMPNFTLIAAMQGWGIYETPEL